MGLYARELPTKEGFERVKEHDLNDISGNDPRNSCNCIDCKIFRAKNPSKWIKFLIFLRIIK